MLHSYISFPFVFQSSAVTILNLWQTVDKE